MQETTQLNRLFELLRNTPASVRPNLVIIEHDEMLFCYKDRLSFSQYASGYGPIKGIRPERGDILDFFTDLELIVDQVVISFLKLDPNVVKHFDELLDTVDLFSKIKLLNSWSLIDSLTKEKLISLKEVRNGFAHRWDKTDIKYKNRRLASNLENFKRDAEDVFNTLVELYNGGKIDVEQIILKLSNESRITS